MDYDHEWTQEELRAHLMSDGWTEKDFIEGEEIPQGVKYISFAPLTESDIARAKQLIAEHPEWNR